MLSKVFSKIHICPFFKTELVVFSYKSSQSWAAAATIRSRCFSWGGGRDVAQSSNSRLFLVLSKLGISTFEATNAPTIMRIILNINQVAEKARQLIIGTLGDYIGMHFIINLAESSPSFRMFSQTKFGALIVRRTVGTYPVDTSREWHRTAG